MQGEGLVVVLRAIPLPSVYGLGPKRTPGACLVAAGLSLRSDSFSDTIVFPADNRVQM